MPSASSARPWLSSEGSLRDQPLSAPRKFRKRRSAGSNAAPRNRSERQALSSTAPQPSSGACARSTSSARATSSVQYPNAWSGTGPTACCQIPSGPVRAVRCARLTGIERVAQPPMTARLAAGRRIGTGRRSGLREDRGILRPHRGPGHAAAVLRTRGVRSPLAPRGSRAARTMASASASGEPGVTSLPRPPARRSRA